MGTIRTEFTADDGHVYVLVHDGSVVCVSDADGSDVEIPISVFRTMSRIVMSCD